MKRVIGLMILTMVLSLTLFAQDKKEEKHATEADKVATFDSEGKIKRGEAIGDSKTVSLSKVLKNPAKYEGKSVRVNGFVVRSCKKEGCWAELGAKKDSKQTVRVDMKDHAFFIPLESAGFKVLTEGVFSVKTLSKEQVEHYREEGAKFENINDDGTVTLVSFLASGIELTKE
ncbi:MAG: DUF4920 domain-containing protein [Pyrinomonadaceae bacterium]